MLEGGVSASLTYEATQGVRNLAGVNTTARLLAAIKAQGADLTARIHAQGAELTARIGALEAKFEAVTGALRCMLVVLVTLALQELSRIPGVGAAVGQAVAAPNGTSMSEPVGASVPDEAVSPAP